MKDDFAAAMRCAALLTRSGDVAGATRAIRNALSGGMDSHAPDAARADAASRPPQRPNLRLVKPGMETPSEPGSSNEVRGETSGRERLPRMRKPLGEVLRRLREGNLRTGLAGSLPGMSMPGTLRAIPPLLIPDGAQFVSRSFTGVAGARVYRLYIPASATDRASGLIVMLHGCKQNPDDFAIGTNMNSVAEAHGLLVAYPAQPASANASSCWNWFNPADQARGAGEPSIIAGITRELISEFNLDRTQVFVAGLSAGGAMAVVMGETYPDVYAAIGTHSGLPYRSANDVMSAFAAMRGEAGMPSLGNLRSRRAGEPLVRTIVFQGSADPTVNPANANRILDTAGRRLGAAKREVRRVPSGRSYTRSVFPGLNGASAAEIWIVDGAGHAWSGGQPGGSYTDPEGPDASAEMVRFFLAS